MKSNIRVKNVCVKIAPLFLLPSVFNMWKTNDANGTCMLEDVPCTWHPGSKQFKRCHIAMSSANHMWLHSEFNMQAEASWSQKNWHC